MSIILLSSDLFSSPTISGAAKSLDIEFQWLMSQQDLVDKISDVEKSLIVIDLSCGKFDVQQCAEVIDLNRSSVTMIAFGPHVHEKKLAAAKDAGCEAVYTKGQFLQHTQAILANHVGG